MIPGMEIRPMLASDIEPATAAILRDDWGARRPWFEFAITHPDCQPIVAELDGEIVGTGVGTVHGSVGWVGTIWVAIAHRGRGLGRTLTEAVTDRLEASGCRTLLLVATEAGRPLYEGLGFTVHAEIQIIEATGIPDEEPAARDDGRQVRPFGPGDLPAMLEMDARATGEDRSVTIRRLAAPDTARVLARDGEVRGFVLRAPWGGGATIAVDPDDGLGLLDARRRAGGAGHRVTAGLIVGNVVGLERAEAAGWTSTWTAPRLIRGAPLDWAPDAIWGQFSHAIG
jgi:ribosomal protein S18 acetylase RimI-like enzyme